MPATFGNVMRKGVKTATKPPGQVLTMLRMLEERPELTLELWPDIGTPEVPKATEPPPAVWSLFATRKRRTRKRR